MRLAEAVKHLPLIIKIIYGAIVVILLTLYYKESAELSFKFLLSFTGVFGYLILMFHSAFQKRSIILFGAIIIFSLLFVFNLIFLGASMLETDVVVITLAEIQDIEPLIYALVFSLLFYLVINALQGWHTEGEERMTKIFIGFLVSTITVEKVISLSSPSFSNIVLSVFLLFIFSDFVKISIAGV